MSTIFTMIWRVLLRSKLWCACVLREEYASAIFTETTLSEALTCWPCRTVLQIAAFHWIWHTTKLFWVLRLSLSKYDLLYGINIWRSLTFFFPFMLTYIQAALLYTSAAGERRIRVHTMVIPVTAVRIILTFFMQNVDYIMLCFIFVHSLLLKWLKVWILIAQWIC